MITWILIGSGAAWTLVVFLALWMLRRQVHLKKLEQKRLDPRLTVCLFHPYCDAGGGGERVLWCALAAMQERFPHARYAVYTGDLHASPDQILEKAHKNFGVELKAEVEFVYLHRRKWVEADRYPYFTLLGQSLGSLVLAFEALFKLAPDIYLDTMGYAFTLPVLKHLCGCRVGCYVHYPTISRDMLRRVAQGRPSHVHRSLLARSPFLTALKLLYYRLFARAYAWAGRSADIVMVNSSWTEDHILHLWAIPDRTHKVFPPCDVDAFKRIPLSDDASKDVKRIVSVAQFRPEKDHPMQIRTMYELRQILSEEQWSRVRLVLIGSCRDAVDESRVQDMRDLCRHLSVEDNVEFKVNIPFPQLLQEMSQATMGIHTMWNEHFGIGVVECMAAGLIMIAHRSGGPMMDIVVESQGAQNGLLAADETEYAQAIKAALMMMPQERLALKEKARASVDRFSQKEFEASFLRAVEPLFR